MTIQQIFTKVSTDRYTSIVLDYDNEIEEFENEWEVPFDVQEENATYKIKNGKLVLTVRS